MQLDLFSIIVIAVVALVGVYAVYIQIKTRKNGIETEAVIINVKETWDDDGDSHSLSYKYTVEYTNFEGKKVAAALGRMTNSDLKLGEGDRVTIKYLKDKQDYQILAEK